MKTLQILIVILFFTVNLTAQNIEPTQDFKSILK